METIHGDSMHQKRHARKLTEQEPKILRIWPDLLTGSLASGLAGIAVSLVATFLSFFVSRTKSPKPDILFISHSLVYFVGAIVLLGIVIVGIATFIRRKN